MPDGYNTYGSIGNQTAGYYSRKLLKHAMPVLILERYGQTKTLPRNETKTMEFRRSKPFTPATIPLTEGVTPQPSEFGYDSVSVRIQQYGDWAGITDHVKDTSKDMVLRDMGVRQGEQIGETRELLMWDVVRAGTNVDYANSADDGRNDTDKDSTLDSAAQRRSCVMLDRLKGKKFTEVLSGSEDYDTYAIEAAYIGVTHSDATPAIRDLKGSNANAIFVPVAKYGSRMGVTSPREVGSYEDVRYVTSPELAPFRGGGAAVANAADKAGYYGTGSGNGNYDVYLALLLARDAFGCIALRGMRERQGRRVGGLPVRPSVLNPGTPRGGDPLGQRGSIGWTMWFACVILNDTWIRRIEFSVAR